MMKAKGDEIGSARSTHGRKDKFLQTVLFFGKPDGRKPLVTLRRRWKYSIEMEVVNWIHLAQNWDSGRLLWIWQ
jgi:hypothetical protein